MVKKQGSVKKPAGKKQPQQQRQQQTGNQRGQLTKAGALWLSEGRNGKFMSGTVDVGDGNAVRVLVFKNSYKEEAKHPDYIIYLPEQDGPGPSQGRLPNTATDDDIPF